MASKMQDLSVMEVEDILTNKDISTFGTPLKCVIEDCKKNVIARIRSDAKVKVYYVYFCKKCLKEFKHIYIINNWEYSEEYLGER